ncbi:pentapeptide repeat-containing protein [Arachnia propionica]|nr:pentapeptide repeat-containing protein [Arachnia propionica]
MSRLTESIDNYGLELSFKAGETVTGEDWPKHKLGRIGSSAILENCNFEGTSAKQVILGGAGWTAEFRNCSFDNTRLKYIIGEAKFINCTFRNARLTEFRVNPLTLINCDFSGALLLRCQFWGAPTPHDLKDRPSLNPVNEVHGNDFSTATFDDSDFRGGVNLTLQQLPTGQDYAISLDGNAALQRATALVDSWGPEREEDQTRARSWINIWQRGIDRGQNHLFAVWPKKRLTPESWTELRQTINET